VNWIQNALKANGIDAFVSGQLEARPLPELIKSKIRESEAFLVLVTEKSSDWVQNEIGIAYDAGKPVYALVQKGVRVEGILPYITVYEEFDLSQPQSLTESVQSFMERIQSSRREKAFAQGVLAILGLTFLLLITKK